MVQPDDHLGLDGSSAQDARAAGASGSASPRPPPSRGACRSSAPRRDAPRPGSLRAGTVREHGPLVRIPLGPARLTLIAHPEDMRRVLQEDNNDYPRGRTIDPIRPMLRQQLADQPTVRPGDASGASCSRPSTSSRLNHLVGAMARVATRYVAGLRRRSAPERLGSDDAAHARHHRRDHVLRTSSAPIRPRSTQAFAELDRYISRYSFVPFTGAVVAAHAGQHRLPPRDGHARSSRSSGSIDAAPERAGEARTTCSTLCSKRATQDGEAMPDHGDYATRSSASSSRGTRPRPTR